MKKDILRQKTGKIYPILLFLFLALVFYANLYKSSALGSKTLDMTPAAASESLETASVPEKTEISLADSFATVSANVSTPTTPRYSEPSLRNFSAPIYNVSDMQYEGNRYYSTYAIMHHASYSHFYYAHNTGAFADLQNLSEGEIFILGGQKYQVKAKILYDYSVVQSSMNSIVRAKYAGVSHDISMMTCAGSRTLSLPNGSVTNTHRLIIYADRV